MLPCWSRDEPCISRTFIIRTQDRNRSLGSLWDLWIDQLPLVIINHKMELLLARHANPCSHGIQTMLLIRRFQSLALPSSKTAANRIRVWEFFIVYHGWDSIAPLFPH